MIFQNIPAIQVALPVNSTGIDKRASPVDIDLPLYFKHSAIFKVAIYTHIRIYLQRTTYFQGASVKIQIIGGDRKSTRLNSSHVAISYAVFCLKTKRNSPSGLRSTVPI